MLPALGRSRPSTARPVVDLPQPLSPTSASVSPRSTSKLTPSTACTAPTCRLSTPRRIGKCTLRSETVSSGSCPGALAAGFRRATAGERWQIARPAASASTRWCGRRRPFPAAASPRGSAPRHSRSAARRRRRSARRRDVGRRALDRHQPGVVGRQRRDRVQQADRVGMRRRRKQLIDRCAFDDRAGIHHRDAIDEAGDQAEVMADPDDRHAELFLQAARPVRRSAPGW